MYRVKRGGAAPLYLVDLPGYGYARREAGQSRLEAVAVFEALARDYFGREHAAGLLLVDARHPGLDADRAAWRWMESTVGNVAIVATKIDKLARGERIRAMKTMESVFETSVLPASAVTGEGLDELWRTIERLASSSPRETATPPRRPPRQRK